jgi:twitching motility protein PilT
VAEIDELLRRMTELGASDLHVAAGLEPRVRKGGQLVAVDGWPVLTETEVRAMLRAMVDEKRWAAYEKDNDLDFAYELPGVARFRANFFRQHRGSGAVCRVIPERIVPLEDLNLPAAVAGLADLECGLVLVTGPTGSGKSTTLAAIIDRINSCSARHIVTIEDPLEFVHQNKKSIVSHREVGAHTRAFAPALRAAVREDADVILVGEMRDLETIANAIIAAEMGVLVFGTLHTNNATKTIDRVIDAFPAAQQAQVRISLSESLTAVVSQLLVPTVDGGRCAVNEILLKTQALPNIIREGNTPMLTNVIQSGRGAGMQTMDDALFAAVQAGKISAEDAAKKAIERSRFES